MRARVLLAITALLMAIVSTVAIGSNMGFKIAIPLINDGNSTTANWVSLPYYNSYTDAASVKADIGPNFASITRWDNTSHSYKTYAGGPNNFPIIPGEGYLIKTVNGTGTTNWVVVGSHNPTLAISLINDGNSTTANWISVPYHTTAVNAAGLKTEIGPNCASITRWDNASHSYKTYTGGPNNFTLTPGEAVLVKMVNGSGTTNWTPAHY